MTANSKVDEIDPEAPLDPAVERVRAKLARLMVISISIMLVSVMAVLGAIVYKVSDSTPTSQANSASSMHADMIESVMIPVGAQVISHSLYEGQISLLLQLSDGRQIVRFVSLQDDAKFHDVELQQK